MNNYDFRSLNDKEFEALVVDLLSAEVGMRIERFKPGRDAGVDGRWFMTPGAEAIVQCKHWVDSGIRRLITHLSTSERAKAERLKCSRYILVTSLPLSRLNKQAIASAMAPYITKVSDVIGAEDLNDLLGRHAVVERRHYKLWLSSSSTLALILNSAIVGRSRAELEQIRHESPHYVLTDEHARAMRHLESRRVLVLTGEPGIGKTTLARQLALEYVANGYEFVVLEESISEAESVFSEDGKQIFYFDDFLGRTFLEAIRSKQDSHVLRFIERVARDARKRFVLTSRTNILNQGAALSDLYANTQIVKNTYELEVKQLLVMDRARILYNHLWHSHLDEEFVDELYQDKRYHEIIRHRNFNPRLVAFVLDAGKVAGVPATRYWEFVTEAFERPAGVWGHFFAAQLSQDDRDLACLVTLNGKSMQEGELRESFFALLARETSNKGIIDARFWKAVQHTAGTVLNRHIGEGPGKTTYTLYNPSIADYLQPRLAESGLWSYYYCCIRTNGALTRLEQLKKQSFFGPEEYRRVLSSLVLAEGKRVNARDAYALRLTRLATEERIALAEVNESLVRLVSEPLLSDDHAAVADMCRLLMAASGRVESSMLLDRAGEIAVCLGGSFMPLNEPETITVFLETLERIGATESFGDVRAQVLDEWRSGLREFVTEHGVLSSYYDLEERDEAHETLKGFVEAQLADMGIELTRLECDEMCSSCDIDDVIRENMEIASREEAMGDLWREQGSREAGDAAAVDDLFDRSGR